MSNVNAKSNTDSFWLAGKENTYQQQHNMTSDYSEWEHRNVVTDRLVKRLKWLFSRAEWQRQGQPNTWDMKPILVMLFPECLAFNLLINEEIRSEAVCCHRVSVWFWSIMKVHGVEDSRGIRLFPVRPLWNVASGTSCTKTSPITNHKCWFDVEHQL